MPKEFKDLPKDIKEKIPPLLNNKSLIGLALTSKELNELTQYEIEQRKIKKIKIEYIKSQIIASIDPQNSNKLVFTDQLASILNDAAEDHLKQNLITQVIIEFNKNNPNITEIEVTDKRLKYFPDVSCFANLTKVNCFGNLLKSLTLKQVNQVNCSNNQLTELNLPKANEVICYNNQLKSLDLPKANYVDCSFNQLTELNLPQLNRIYCYNNRLKSLDLPKATHINCTNNPELYRENVFAPNCHYLDFLPSKFRNETPTNNPLALLSSAINNRNNESNSPPH